MQTKLNAFRLIKNGDSYCVHEINKDTNKVINVFKVTKASNNSDLNDEYKFEKKVGNKILTAEFYNKDDDDFIENVYITSKNSIDGKFDKSETYTDIKNVNKYNSYRKSYQEESKQISDTYSVDEKGFTTLKEQSYFDKAKNEMVKKFNLDENPDFEAELVSKTRDGKSYDNYVLDKNNDGKSELTINTVTAKGEDKTISRGVRQSETILGKNIIKNAFDYKNHSVKTSFNGNTYEVKLKDKEVIATHNGESFSCSTETFSKALKIKNTENSINNNLRSGSAETVYESLKGYKSLSNMNIFAAKKQLEPALKLIKDKEFIKLLNEEFANAPERVQKMIITVDFTNKNAAQYEKNAEKDVAKLGISKTTYKAAVAAAKLVLGGNEELNHLQAVRAIYANLGSLENSYKEMQYFPKTMEYMVDKLYSVSNK